MNEHDLEQQILATAPQTAQTADALLEAKQYTRACDLLRKGVAKYPDEPYLRYTLALACYHGALFEECLEHAEQVPDTPETRLILAQALTKLSDLARALPLYQSLYGTYVNHDMLMNDHAEALVQAGRPCNALRLLEGRSSVRSTYHAGYVRLGLGDWPAAWHLFRHRDIFHDNLFGADKRPLTLNDVGGRVLLFEEQGIGDVIQYLRYAPLVRRWCDELIIAVQGPMMRLAETLGIDAMVVNIDGQEGIDQSLPDYDVAIPLADCPALFDTTLTTVPPNSYQLTHKSPETRKIGLCWQGGYRPHNVDWNAIDRRRSFPFETFAPLLSLDCDCVSLQLESSPLPRLFQRDFDLYESAIRLNEVDLVITVDTAIAHLAGAVNCPVWLLSRFDGCWRWLWDGSETTPWYPSMRIFRQTTPGDWSEVIERVRQKLISA